jgi:hypothetical protein
MYTERSKQDFGGLPYNTVHRPECLLIVHLVTITVFILLIATIHHRFRFHVRNSLF